MATVQPDPAGGSSVWASEDLFAKAQRYAEDMLSQPRDEWKFGLWASLMLEHLARAALAHVSPTLLADPKDWHNLYRALGHTPTAARYLPKSVDVSTVLGRLREVVPGFDDKLEGVASLHISRRNDELHSGNCPYDALKNSIWLPGFYEVCDLFAKFIGESLDTLLGPDEARVAANLISASQDQSAKAVLSRIKAHNAVWVGKAQQEKDLLSNQATTWAMRQNGHRVKCPACGCQSLLDGAPTAPAAVYMEDGEIIETQFFLPSKFECIACGLKISGLAELRAADLDEPYKATTTYTAAEYYADQLDPYAGYEPDYNEP